MKNAITNLALLLVISAGCAGMLSIERTPPATMVVTASDAYLHSIATWGHKIKDLAQNERVIVIGAENAYWYAVAGRDTGFIDKSDVASLEDAAIQVAQKAASAAALAEPLTITISTNEAPTAWARASQFVAQHSDMKIQIATDVLLETYNPTGGALFGYQITKVPLQDGVEITVSCMYETGIMDAIDKGHAEENAHAAAYYIRTGVLAGSLLH